MPTFLTEDKFATRPYGINWLELPQDGNKYMQLNPDNVTPQECSYEYRDQVITIDITAGNIKRTQCIPGHFNFFFYPKESVLLAENISDSQPIHIKFSPGVKAVGTAIAPGAPQDFNANDVSYYASMSVMLDNLEQRYPVEMPVTSNFTKKSAPFLGIQADPGCLITDLFIDALARTAAPNRSKFTQVAIGELLCVW